MSSDNSPLQNYRAEKKVVLPELLQTTDVYFQEGTIAEPETDHKRIKSDFPYSYGQHFLTLKKRSAKDQGRNRPMNLGVCFSGGQASGGHNVIAGLFDFLSQSNPASQLFGFKGGPKGIFTGNVVKITADFMDKYRNQGGFNMIGSGRDKIESLEQKEKSLTHCKNLGLEGIVIIGGDDSNTNGALLAEFFKSKKVDIKVIGVPKTIDGDLRNKYIEISFGFDTACKVYSECIGNLCYDAISSKRSYHFVKLMGRSASHIALECALQTRPTYTLIGEEVKEKNKTLRNIVNEICDLICYRAKHGRNYGIILIPEGLVEFIPEMSILFIELNSLLSKKSEISIDQALSLLHSAPKETFSSLPLSIQRQLLMDRDSHGNVQVAQIDTQRLLIDMCESEIKKRKQTRSFQVSNICDPEYRNHFTTRAHYFGYEGRSCLPSLFDVTYCYSLGRVAAALMTHGYSGYMATITNLASPIDKWSAGGVPLVAMLNYEERKGKSVPVIKKALTDLNGNLFKIFAENRETWGLYDCFRNPGPIQFDGPCATNVCFHIKPPLMSDFTSRKTLELRDKDLEKNIIKPWHIPSPQDISLFQKDRNISEIPLPSCLQNYNCQISNGAYIGCSDSHTSSTWPNEYPSIASIAQKVNGSYKMPVLNLIESTDSCIINKKDIVIGICFMGKQTPGGMNLITGLLAYLKKQSSSSSKLIGFLSGAYGLFQGIGLIVTEENFSDYYNQGGCHFLGVGEDSQRIKKDLKSAKNTCNKFKLDGLVMVGGSHTMSDVVIFSDYLISQKSKTRVIGVPGTSEKTIIHPLLESCIGFDTVTKLHSQLIGNLLIDAASAAKYYYFVRVMGKDPSHVVMECAFQTHPNIVIISEECARLSLSFNDIVQNIANDIIARFGQKKNYGVVILGEGLLQHVPVFSHMIHELNTIYLKENPKFLPQQQDIIDALKYICPLLSNYSSSLLKSLPSFIQEQLLIQRKAGTRINTSKIETERLLMTQVTEVLKQRKNEYDSEKFKFAGISFFLGYQVRSATPSLYDCALGTSSGFTAGVLIASNYTGYMVSARRTNLPFIDWQMIGIPLIALLSEVQSSIFNKVPHIASSEVDLNGKAFAKLKAERRRWLLGDCYSNPGPYQFYGPCSNTLNTTLQLEHKKYVESLLAAEHLTNDIMKMCSYGIPESILEGTVLQLRSIRDVIKIMKLHLEKNDSGG